MWKYKYEWRIGITPACDRELRTTDPLYEGARLVDLVTGDRLAVSHVFEQKIMKPGVPEMVIQCWPAGRVSEAELRELRAKDGYDESEFYAPLDWVVFEKQA